MSSAKLKRLLGLMGSGLVLGACAGLTGTDDGMAAKSSTGIPLGKSAPHPVQPLADKPRFGKPISEADVAPWNIDIRTSDGHGLPAGRGSVAEGKQVYAAKCASCHVPPTFTDAPTLHAAGETGVDPVYATR